MQAVQTMAYSSEEEQTAQETWLRRGLANSKVSPMVWVVREKGGKGSVGPNLPSSFFCAFSSM
jgi:hypothetical protein